MAVAFVRPSRLLYLGGFLKNDNSFKLLLSRQHLLSSDFHDKRLEYGYTGKCQGRHVHFLASTIGQEGSIDIKYEHGLVLFSIQLPSRKEKCQFTLKATTNTLYNLIHDLKLEDKGIDRVVAYNLENERLARSTPLYLMLQKDFYLYVNDIKYYCKSPASGNSLIVPKTLELEQLLSSMVKIYS